MVPLSYLSVLEFAGNDASQFLQTQLSADVSSIPQGDASFACYCNPSGRVLALLLVRPGPDACLAICSADLAEPTVALMSRFVLRADVRISVRPGLVVGGHVETGEGIRVFHNPLGLEYAILPAGGTAPAACDPDLRSWRCRELEAGVAWLTPATSAMFLPQMLGSERIGALSFRKGCFPGQEIIARTRYLGRLKRHPLLCRVRGDLRPEPLSEITLSDGASQAQAVVLEHAPDQDGSVLLFMVARMDAEFSPATLAWAGREFEAVVVSPGNGPGQG